MLMMSSWATKLGAIEAKAPTKSQPVVPVSLLLGGLGLLGFLWALRSRQYDDLEDEDELRESYPHLYGGNETPYEPMPEDADRIVAQAKGAH